MRLDTTGHGWVVAEKGDETRGGTSADAEASSFAEATEDGPEDGMADRLLCPAGEDADATGHRPLWRITNSQKQIAKAPPGGVGTSRPHPGADQTAGFSRASVG